MTKYRNIEISKYRQGFTLIETLLAVAILAMAITGPIALATRSVAFIGTASNQIIAFYLAQEGIEYIRNTRDENFLNQTNWLGSFGTECSGAGGCYIDVPKSGSNITACDAGGCPPINYDDNKSWYTYDTGTPTIFTRTIKLTTINADEVRIDSTVSWEGKIGTRNVALQENIFNWRP